MADLYSPNDPHIGSADYGHGTDRPVQADIPAQPGTNRGRRNGVAAGFLAFLGLILSKLSYIGLFALKFKGLLATLISTGVTALIYTQIFGLAFGVGIVLLILIHESGHVVVARIMGLPVTLPVMIPFLGAFVSMKQQPRTVAQESIMAIGGPVLDPRRPVLPRLPGHARLEHRSAAAGAGLLRLLDQPVQPDPADPAGRWSRHVPTLEVVQRGGAGDRRRAAALRDADRNHGKPGSLPGLDFRGVRHLATVPVDDPEPGLLRGGRADQGHGRLAVPRVTVCPWSGYAPDLRNPEFEIR